MIFILVALLDLNPMYVWHWEKITLFIGTSVTSALPVYYGNPSISHSSSCTLIYSSVSGIQRTRTLQVIWGVEKHGCTSSVMNVLSSMSSKVKFLPMYPILCFSPS
jgi:hypothetical protein